MGVAVLGSVLLLISSADQPADLGARMLPRATDERIILLPVTRAAPASVGAVNPSSFDLGSAANLGNGWGTVTSTTRTVAHNRAVGGVPNSFHLRGRAIDIARRSGVRHAQIEAAYRDAGYHLVESLDEGDHSHFAFGAPSSSRSSKGPDTATRWGIVYAPSR